MEQINIQEFMMKKTVNVGMKWSADAPANIALIKYMGKVDESCNLPSNPSLSYTLHHLRSFVELEVSENEPYDIWQPLPGFPALLLSEREQLRYLAHLGFIKNYFNFEGTFYLRSANNFPSACGMASSSSSFSALTLCAVKAISELQGQAMPSMKELSQLSRQGSGSSCRSLFSPYSLWQDDYAEAMPLPYPELMHMSVVVSEEAKKVSSSQAHRLVTSSLLFEGRPGRAVERLKQLIAAFQHRDWYKAYEVLWQEFSDMHALFETASPSFSYFTPDTVKVLQTLRSFWDKNKDGPLVTMDAGPNIHLLFRPDQLLAYETLAKTFSVCYKVHAPCLKN